MTKMYYPLQTQTAADLAAEDLPPIFMVIGNVVPAGLLLFAGDPKVGKSLLWLEVCLSIASGQPVFGVYDVPRGDCLYLCFEGGKISLRGRMMRMLAQAGAPSNLHLVYDTANRLGAGLEEAVEAWLLGHPEAKMIVIDTLAAVMPTGRSGGNDRHHEDYQLLAGLAALATRWPQLLIVVIHHTRKSEADDAMHRISGSQGLTAATDGNAVLTRAVGSKQLVLHVRPRNAEESEVVLQRDPESLRLTLVGEDEQAQLSDSRQVVLRLLQAAGPDGAGPKEVAATGEVTYDNARRLLSTMEKDRQIKKVARGRYTVVIDLTD